jgi:hypothetical protein
MAYDGFLNESETKRPLLELYSISKNQKNTGSSHCRYCKGFTGIFNYFFFRMLKEKAQNSAAIQQ